MLGEEGETLMLWWYLKDIVCPACGEISLAMIKKRFKSTDTGEKYEKGHVICCCCHSHLELNLVVTVAVEPSWFRLGGENVEKE